MSLNQFNFSDTDFKGPKMKSKLQVCSNDTPALTLTYGKVKFDSLCFYMGKS